MRLRLRRKSPDNRTPGEDEEPIEGKASPMVEGGLLAAMKKAAVPELLDQQTEAIVQGVEGHPNGAEVTVEEEGLVTNVIGVINGDIDRLSVRK